MVVGVKICECFAEVVVVVFVWVSGCVEDVAVTTEDSVHCVIYPSVVSLVFFCQRRSVAGLWL